MNLVKYISDPNTNPVSMVCDFGWDCNLGQMPCFPYKAANFTSINNF